MSDTKLYSNNLKSSIRITIYYWKISLLSNSLVLNFHSKNYSKIHSVRLLANQSRLRGKFTESNYL